MVSSCQRTRSQRPTHTRPPPQKARGAAPVSRLHTNTWRTQMARRLQLVLVCVLAALLLVLLPGSVRASDGEKEAAKPGKLSKDDLESLKTHEYDEHDRVVVWANKVGPYNNPHETYKYFSLPFCHTQGQKRKEGLGEHLEGYKLVDSGIDVRFKDSSKKATICRVSLDSSKLIAFRKAVELKYWYQLYLDDMPVWGMVGRVLDKASLPSANTQPDHIYTHQSFSIGYNGRNVVDVNLTSEHLVPLEAGSMLEFTYSVTWVESEIKYEDRFRKYLVYSFFEHNIHWFSIFNSFMIVVFLSGIVSMILMRTLKQDYARYARSDDDYLEDELDREVGDESGWKQIHGDVFRQPEHIELLAAALGSGAQLLATVFLLILYAISTGIWPGRGTLLTAVIFLYAMCGFFGGLVSGAFYKTYPATRWIRCMLYTWALFPVLSFTITLLINFVAIAYSSMGTIPFGTMVVVLLIWMAFDLASIVGGTIVGRNLYRNYTPPCKVSSIPRQIPAKQWYMQPSMVALLGGILPFGSIFIEMYFIFSSFFSYKYYYVYGFALLVSFILVIVTVCVTIVWTYILLNAEEYRWQWMSFFSAASCAAYILLYAVYFYYYQTQMSGMLQTAYYFGSVIQIAVGIGLACGAVGMLGTSVFVHRIYANVKID